MSKKTSKEATRKSTAKTTPRKKAKAKAKPKKKKKEEMKPVEMDNPFGEYLPEKPELKIEPENDGEKEPNEGLQLSLGIDSDPEDKEAEKDKAEAAPKVEPEKKKADINPVETSRCKNCGSTSRTKYHNTIKRKLGGIDENGKKYTHTTWKRTICKNCDQHRVDIFRLNR